MLGKCRHDAKSMSFVNGPVPADSSLPGCCPASQRAIARLQHAAEAAPEVGASLELDAAKIGDNLEDVTELILVRPR